MKNKNVIRKETKSGKFTTVQNSILFDTRLAPNAFRLLTAILSDSDTAFNLSQTLYCKRLNITKQTFLNAITNLEECGYLRKSPIKGSRLKNYTISEFGNLNVVKEEKLQEIVEQPNVEISDDDGSNRLTDISFEELQAIVNQRINYCSEGLLEDVVSAIKDAKTNLEIKTIVFKDYYKSQLACAKDSEKYPKAFNEFKQWLKAEIFEKEKYDLNSRNKWAILSRIKYAKKYKTDYETMMGDYHENPKD